MEAIKKKPSPQQKHLRANYKKFAIDLRPEVLEAFKRNCKERGTTPTTVLKDCIRQYNEA